MADRSDAGDSTGAVVELVVEAALSDVGLPAPNPGTIYSISLMRYEVIKIIQGRYPHPAIFVGHHRPDLSEREFTVGGKHRLRLSKEFPEHASILDKFQTPVSRNEPYFCLSFEFLS